MCPLSMRACELSQTDRSLPACKSLGKWTPRRSDGDILWALCVGCLCTAFPDDSSMPVFGTQTLAPIWTQFLLPNVGCSTGRSLHIQVDIHPQIFSIRFSITRLQTTTTTLSSQTVQINCCGLRAWVFVKFKQMGRAQELCSIAFRWQPAPSSSPRQSDVLMGLLAHQLPSHHLRRSRSSRSLIQTRVLVLQLWNKEVLLTPNLASILSHFHK